MGITAETQARGPNTEDSGTGVAEDHLGSQSIDVLNLCPRIRHLLARYHIHTIYELSQEIDTLQELRGFGPIAIAEIRGALEHYDPSKFHPQDIPDEKNVQLPIPSPPLQSWVARIPPDICLDQVSIRELQLSIRTKNALLRAGVSTLGDLAAYQCEITELKFRNFGGVAVQEFSEKLGLWIRRATQEPILQLENSTDVGEPETSITPAESLKILLTSLKQEQLMLVQSLYGLNSDTGMTLQELGDLKGVTRARIGQKKNVAIRQITHLINTRCSFPLAIFIEDAIQRSQGVISNKRLIDELTPELSPTGYSPQGVLQLLCDIGLEKIKPRLVPLAAISAWVTADANIDQILTVHQVVLDEFSQNSTPLPWHDLISILHQNSDLLALQEDYAFAIVRSMIDNGLLVLQSDGSLTFPKTKAMNRRQQMIETLRNIGNPTHYKEIRRVHNELFPDKPISDHSVMAILSDTDNTFVRVGRGTYGLAEWGLNNDGNLANAAWRVLNEQRRPMTVSEIVAEVKQTWQVQSYSIQVAIDSDTRFSKLDDGRISLTKRGLSIKKVKKRDDKTRRERLVEIVRQIGKPIDYHEITHHHNQLYPGLPLTDSAVYNALIQHKREITNIGGGVFGLADWGVVQKQKKSSASNRLNEVLDAVGRPMYYKEIHCVHNQLYPETPVTLSTVSQILNKRTEIFYKAEKGIFGLAEWTTLPKSETT